MNEWQTPTFRFTLLRKEDPLGLDPRNLLRRRPTQTRSRNLRLHRRRSCSGTALRTPSIPARLALAIGTSHRRSPGHAHRHPRRHHRRPRIRPRRPRPCRHRRGRRPAHRPHRHPRRLAHAALSLLLFRIFDILKPPPVRQLERLPEGTGIMLDDVSRRPARPCSAPRSSGSSSDHSQTRPLYCLPASFYP